jgi:hypothetical protein
MLNTESQGGTMHKGIIELAKMFTQDSKKQMKGKKDSDQG